jgi:hypothetical protein
MGLQPNKGKRAQPLIEALERYRQSEGYYPQDEQDLVPTYLSAIPKPAWRYPYFYIVCTDGTAYTVGFRPRGHSDLTLQYWDYSSEHQAWKYWTRSTCLRIFK